MAAWSKVCDGCRWIKDQGPDHHCYMFRDAPGLSCAQNTVRMEQAKKEGNVVQLSELPHLVLEELQNSA